MYVAWRQRSREAVGGSYPALASPQTLNGVHEVPPPPRPPQIPDELPHECPVVAGAEAGGDGALPPVAALGLVEGAGFREPVDVVCGCRDEEETSDRAKGREERNPGVG